MRFRLWIIRGLGRLLRLWDASASGVRKSELKGECS